MKQTVSLLLLLGALPLLIYPFVLLANVMSLAGHWSGNEPLGLVVTVYAFLIGSTAYPAVYIFHRVYANALLKQNKTEAALRYSVGPLLYLALLAGFMMLWGAK